MARKLKRIEDSLPDSPDALEITKILFHSILSYLSKKEGGSVSKTEIKELLLDSLNLVKGFRVEWGEIQKFGKGKLIVSYKGKAALLDIEEISESILRLWERHLDSHYGKR